MAWIVFACSNTGIVVSNPTWGLDVCVLLFCVCVVPCIGRGLETGWSPVQGVLPTVYGIKKLKKRPRPNKGLWSHRNICFNRRVWYPNTAVLVGRTIIDHVGVWDRWVGTAKRYGLDGRNLISGRARFFLFQSGQTGSGAHPPSYPVVGHGRTLSPEIKRPGREPDCLPPCSDQVKHSGAIPPLSLCFHGTVLN
jgi:hypothetical protein